jgi:DNA adenine methylase
MTTKKGTSLGKYPGTKGKMMRRLLELFMAADHNHFVSVFGGFGAEILCKPPSNIESYNDMNHDIYNLYRMLQEKEDALIYYAERTFYHRTILQEKQELLRSGRGSEFERALATLVVANMSICAQDPTLRASFAVGRRSAGQAKRWQNISETIKQVAHRFRGVQLFSERWEWVLNTFDSPTTLFTIDPPYLPSTLSSAAKLYRHELTEDDHVRLLLRIQRLKGKWLLFGYDSRLYRSMLKPIEPMRCHTYAFIGMSARKKSPRVECVWRNF